MAEKEIDVLDCPRRGRPPLPEHERKARLCLSVSRNAVDYIDSARGGSSRSEFVEGVLTEARHTEDPLLARRNGVVYTPSVLADYIAREVLKCAGAAYRRKEGKRLPRPLKVLDPACGNGELLAAVWRGLSDNISSAKSQHVSLPNAHDTLFGIDIDPRAAQEAAARIAMLNSSPSERSTKTPALCTNALFPFGAETSEAGWERALDYFGVTDGFDIVIANPPWGADTSAYREKLSRREFSLYQGQFDTSDLFLEMSLKVTRPGGHIAFIVPDSLFSLERASLRKMLLEQTQIRLVARLGERLFEGIRRACAVIICQKTKPRPNSKVRCFRLTPNVRNSILSGEIGFSQADQELSHKVLQSRFLNSKGHMLSIDVTDQDEDLIGHLESAPPLGTFLTSKRGVELSKAGMVAICGVCNNWAPAPAKKEFTCPSCGHEDLSERLVTRSIVHERRQPGTSPLYVGESLSRYSLSRPRWIERCVPGINYKDDSSYLGPKILVRKTGVGISAHMDCSNALTNQVVYMLQLKDVGSQNKLPLELFLAILNSRAMYYYLTSRHGEREWRSHPYITQTQLMSLPAPTQARLGRFANHVSLICSTLGTRIHNGTALDEREDAQIESSIAKLYGLKKKDYQRIYSMIDNVQDLLPVRALKRVALEDLSW